MKISKNTITNKNIENNSANLFYYYTYKRVTLDLVALFAFVKEPLMMCLFFTTPYSAN